MNNYPKAQLYDELFGHYSPTNLPLKWKSLQPHRESTVSEVKGTKLWLLGTILHSWGGGGDNHHPLNRLIQEHKGMTDGPDFQVASHGGPLQIIHYAIWGSKHANTCQLYQ